jgi:hypothetical protein
LATRSVPEEFSYNWDKGINLPVWEKKAGCIDDSYQVVDRCHTDKDRQAKILRFSLFDLDHW